MGLEGEFSWAIDLLKNGKKIRMKNWHTEYFFKEIDTRGYIIDSDDRIVNFTLRHYEGKNWEVYEN